jgi:hypothetical protein
VLNIVPGEDEAAAGAADADADDEDDEEEEELVRGLDAVVLDELLQAAPSSTMPASATTTVNRRGRPRCWKSITGYLLESLDRFVPVIRTSGTNGFRWINLQSDAVARTGLREASSAMSHNSPLSSGSGKLCAIAAVDLGGQAWQKS